METQALTEACSSAEQAQLAREKRVEHFDRAGEDRAATQQAAAVSYSGNILVVTTAMSPYADPSAFVEEGVPQDAELMTNYAYLEVLARPNPRRFVDFKPLKAGAKLKDRPPMRVTTPNRHTEIMLEVERSLRRLHADAKPKKLSGGLRMQEISVVRINATVGADCSDANGSPSSSKYVELPSEMCPAATEDGLNLWLHVTHRDEATSAGFQTPAAKFAFDLADARCHSRAGEDDRSKALGVPWVASDPELSRELQGPSAERRFPAHSRLFLDHIETNSDLVAEQQIMKQADALEPLTPSQVDVRKLLKERWAGRSCPCTSGPNTKLWEVKVELLPLGSAETQSTCLAKPYFVGVLIYSYTSPNYLLELDYGAFSITPSGSCDDILWKITGSVDGHGASELRNRQVRSITRKKFSRIIDRN